MDSSRRVERTALALAVLSLMAVAVLFRTPGKGTYAFLFVGFMVGGTTAGLVALLASSRKNGSLLVRCVAAVALFAFFCLLMWAGYIATHVPLS